MGVQDVQDTVHMESLATEMLRELKHESKRKSIIIATMLFLWFATIGMFIWYLNQYDFSSTTTTTNSASGVYAIVDSEGNVIASDIDENALNELLGGATDDDGQ